jgi:Uma2 family endonuclease
MTGLAYDWLPRHKLTVADYHRVGQTGVLGEDDRVELIDGEIVDMAPIGSEHAGTVTLLAKLFQEGAGDSAVVWVQNPVSLDSGSEPQPDLALLRPKADFYRSGHPDPTDVLLLVEVADASMRYDREVKLPLYARHGVPEVWLVDLQNRRFEFFLRPNAAEYESHQVFEKLPNFAPEGLPVCQVNLSALW